MPCEQEIRQLDQAVLDSVLTGRVLPGMHAPIALPDVGWILRQPAILVLDEGLTGSLSGDSLSVPLRVVSQAALKAESHGSETAYLKLNNEVIDATTVRVTLEVLLVSANGESAGLGLSSVHVTFRKRDGEWVVEDSPAISAA